jgi:hypothetical protein
MNSPPHAGVPVSVTTWFEDNPKYPNSVIDK